MLIPQTRTLFPALPRRTRDGLLCSHSSNGKSSERPSLTYCKSADCLPAFRSSAPLHSHPVAAFTLTLTCTLAHRRSPVTRRTRTASGAPLYPRASDSAWHSIKLLNKWKKKVPYHFLKNLPSGYSTSVVSNNFSPLDIFISIQNSPPLEVLCCHQNTS